LGGPGLYFREGPCVLCGGRHLPCWQVVPDPTLVRFVPEKLANNLRSLLRKQFCTAIQLSPCPRQGCAFVLEHQGAEVRLARRLQRKRRRERGVVGGVGCGAVWWGVYVRLPRCLDVSVGGS
jgi:hypothetical protein